MYSKERKEKQKIRISILIYTLNGKKTDGLLILVKVQKKKERKMECILVIFTRDSSKLIYKI